MVRYGWVPQADPRSLLAKLEPVHSPFPYPQRSPSSLLNTGMAVTSAQQILVTGHRSASQLEVPSRQELLFPVPPSLQLSLTWSISPVQKKEKKVLMPTACNVAAKIIILFVFSAQEEVVVLTHSNFFFFKE